MLSQKKESVNLKKDYLILSQKQEKKKQNEELQKSLRKIYEIIKRTDTFSMGVPEGEDSAKGAQGLFEAIMHKNVPNSRKEMHVRIQ